MLRLNSNPGMEPKHSLLQQTTTAVPYCPMRYQRLQRFCLSATGSELNSASRQERRFLQHQDLSLRSNYQQRGDNRGRAEESGAQSFWKGNGCHYAHPRSKRMSHTWTTRPWGRASVGSKQGEGHCVTSCPFKPAGCWLALVQTKTPVKQICIYQGY